MTGTKRFLFEVEGYGDKGYAVRLLDLTTQEKLVEVRVSVTWDLHGALSDLGRVMAREAKKLGLT